MKKFLSHFRVLLIVVFLLASAKMNAQLVTFTQALKADGGICNLNDTVKIAGLFNAGGVYQNVAVLAMDYGDGNRDTLKFPSPTSSGMSKSFAFAHRYNVLGTYQVKVKGLINNIVYDSASLSVTLGNCQKASGSFFYDLNTNCVQDEEECGYNIAFVNFFNNGTPTSVYIEPVTGKFSIPVYSGDSYLPPSGILAQGHAQVGASCTGTAYPAITAATSNYKVRAIVNDPVWVTDLSGPTKLCKGSLGGFYASVSSGTNWKVNFDLDDGVGIETGFSSCGSSWGGCYTVYKSALFPEAGSRTVTAFSYRTLNSTGTPYGPLSKKSITVDVYECDTIVLRPYIDNSFDCANDAGEYQINGNNQLLMDLESVQWGGQCAQTTLPNGNIAALLLPNDTVTIHPIQYYYPDYYFGNQYIQYNNIAKSNCLPQTITNADDTVDIAFKHQLKLFGLNISGTGNACIGDQITYAFNVASLGFTANDSLRFIALYSDGINDTIILHPGTIDTFVVSGSRDIVSYLPNFSGQFIVQSIDGTLSDTLTQQIGLNNCAQHRVKVFYDANKNCVKDPGEIYLTNFQIISDGSDTHSGNADSAIHTTYGWMSQDNLRNIRLFTGSALGKGFYNREFTGYTCTWPTFGMDTAAYEIPLIDTVTLRHPNITHVMFAFPETNNMPACDTLYKPVIRGVLAGNRNEANDFQFAYNKGNGAPYVMYPFPVNTDIYSDTAVSYYFAGPETPYAAGSYVPGYELIRQSTDMVYRYTRPGNPLQVLQNCQPPKARLFADNDGNCSYNSGDNPVAGVLVEVIRNGQSQYTMSNANGYISFMANNGDAITINVPDQLTSGKSLKTTCTPNNYSYTYVSNPSDTVLFAYDCNGAVNPLDVSVTASHTAFNPSQTDTILINATFSNCHVGGGQITIDLDPALQFIGAGLPGYQINGNAVSWNLDTLNQHNIYPIKVAVNAANAPAATWLCNEISILPNSPDVNLSNNYFTLCDTLLQVIPQQFKTGGTDSVYLQTGNPVVYAIFFENNTQDTVSHVLITDTISPLLDISTLQILSSSHNFTTSIVNNTVLRFTHDSIHLAPNEVGSVQFSLLPAGNIVTGTVIYNNATVLMGGAGILGSNLTVLTAARPVVDTGTDVNNTHFELLSMLVYPNPATDLLNVKIEGHKSLEATITIVDVQGRIVYEDKLRSSQSQISTSRFTSGMYLLKYRDGKKEKTVKFNVLK